MINEAETFVYRNRLASLVKIDLQLIYAVPKTHLVSSQQKSKSPGHQACVSGGAEALRTFLPNAYIALE
jgi:hypothetical protein